MLSCIRTKTKGDCSSWGQLNTCASPEACTTKNNSAKTGPIIHSIQYGNSFYSLGGDKESGLLWTTLLFWLVFINQANELGAFFIIFSWRLHNSSHKAAYNSNKGTKKKQPKQCRSQLQGLIKIPMGNFFFFLKMDIIRLENGCLSKSLIVLVLPYFSQIISGTILFYWRKKKCIDADQQFTHTGGSGERPKIT